MAKSDAAWPVARQKIEENEIPHNTGKSYLSEI